MPDDDNGNGRRFRPTMTGPIPQTPELPFRPYDPANPKGKQNEPQASVQDGKDLGTPPAPADNSPSYRIFDPTAAPVPQQLSYHFFSSIRPTSHEQSPDRDSTNEAIRQTVPEETTTDGAHVAGAINIESMQAAKDMPSPAAKGSEARHGSNTKKHLTHKQQESHNRKERETAIAPKKRPGDIELPQAASKKQRMKASGGSLSPSISVDAPDSSRTRTQKPYVRKNIADTQSTRTALRTSTSDQHIRRYEDDTDDDEEKPQALTDSQSGHQTSFGAHNQSTPDRLISDIDAIIAAWGEKNVDSIPGKVKKDLWLQDEVMKWVSGSTTPSFERARGWVNYATVMRLKYSSDTQTRTRRAIREDWSKAWKAVTMYEDTPYATYVHMSYGGKEEAPKLKDEDLQHVAVKTDEKTGFLRPDPRRKPKPSRRENLT